MDEREEIGNSTNSALTESGLDVAASEVDPSPELDAVTIMELQGVTGEVEALSVKSILDSNNIPSVMVGTSTLPNLSFMIQVPAAEVDRARAAIAEAQAAGPAAAVEAEREGELNSAMNSGTKAPEV